MLTETSDDEEKDGYFDTLERPYDISPRNHVKIVLGDYHEQVGMEAVNFPTVGNCILHSLTNDKGSSPIQFAISRSMIIRSTFYPCKDFDKSNGCHLKV